MKLFSLTFLVLLTSCSSVKEKKNNKSLNVTNESFKKEKPLSKREVLDYYASSINGALSPALQDETIDRHSLEEISHLNSSPDPILNMAVLCSKGSYEEAFAVASGSFDRYQKVPVYWNQVANCHLNQGNHRKALLFYNKALEVSPNYVPALNNIGVLYTRENQDQKALVAFERASKSSKFSKTPRFNLAKLYLKYGLADHALPIFNSLLGDSPSDVGLLGAVGSAHFMLGSYQQAVQYFQKIPSSNQGSPEVGLNYALALQMLGRERDARNVLGGVREPSESQLKNYYHMVKGQLGENK